MPPVRHRVFPDPATGGIGDKISLELAPPRHLPGLGRAGMQLGAGRAKATDGVDFAVGFDQLVKTGDTVPAGHPLCRIHARTTVDFDMTEAMLGKAVKISSH